jgi:arylsulfatase A-like enzyme
MTRNVLLFIIDTVRKDYFDEFADTIQELSDVSFEQCRAASSCSVPSHGSILTERLPSQSGIHNFNVDYASVPTEETFLGRFSDYRTIGVSANEYVGTAFGFSSHFDSWSNISPYHRFEDGIDIKYFSSAGDGADANGIEFYFQFLKTAFRHDAPVQSMLNGAAGQLDQWLAHAPVPKLLDDGAKPVSRKIRNDVTDTDEPFFLFANYMDAHYPMHHVLGFDSSLHDASYRWTSFGFEGYQELMYNVDDAFERYDEFVSTYRDLYAAAIDYLDRQVASTVRSVLDATERETTIVVTSDHGENLGYEADDHMFWHSSSLTEGLLHVPLEIINPPEGFDPVEEQLFSQRNLGKLLAALAEERTPDLFEERAPAEIVGGDVGATDGLLTSEEQEWFDRAQRAVVSTEQKTLWDSLGTVTGYELDPDRPCWQRETDADVSTDIGEEFFDTDIVSYRRQVDAARAATDAEVTDATKERLEELGYR